ncbi:flagellar hook assembly protein FlgD [Catenovulum sediminis]|uniref:flagellar hook assembly protein FlgD n=1 Tax=Catenovulum sediminis TaxID=1740262 RepID=UPI00163D47CB|nr:flagellar hook capping FlgD N-terminal domain-containing protein [Catenovulum sediminis]
MQVDAIGSTVGSTSSESVNSIDLEGFLKLFITQLTYQDPLEPTKNEDFLAQMAQFAALDQQRQVNEGVSGLATISSSQQSLSLLGKSIAVNTSVGNVSGEVTAIRYTTDGAELTIRQADGNFIPSIKMSQITLIQEQSDN